MSGIISHGYIGLTAPDIGEWRRFATEVLGMVIEDGPDEGQILLRMDARSWRISIEPGDGGLAFSGWEVADGPSLKQVVAKLEANGVATKEDPDLAAKRRVNGLVTCQDPDGNQIEIFHGPFTASAAFQSPTGAVFVTSKPGWGELSFGHAVILVSDEAEAAAFYVGLLGLRLSDTMIAGGGEANFLHVNGRHHSLAYGKIPGVAPSLNHIMVEVATLDMVGRALDVVNRTGVPLAQTLGRHTNDGMVSFYVKTPSGFFLEYGCDGILVDDATWTSTSFEAPSVWGHIGFPGTEGN